ncbi:MAG: hypothetical protein AVDCRST_MAG93-7601 [uncultured Chloroflexia bacterium]|uniref:Uncharacterized protein n=1 Tax=uncultured Chloroflexia bacterium TaxID=1672391 RepID=A0A6J4MJW5_9CHLR|nr:MAG: hypothetical protein AVDCRST_MAG93-7601 [uncultured Chloroflexia bacterium]
MRRPRRFAGDHAGILSQREHCRANFSGPSNEPCQPHRTSRPPCEDHWMAHCHFSLNADGVHNPSGTIQSESR